MKNLITVLFVFISLATKAQEAYSITGTVEDDKGSLPGATVFIANSQKATATNSKGEFNLNGLQPGSYELTVKMLGYELFAKPITIQKSNIDLKILLKENSIMLKTVNISAMSTADRKIYLALFIKSLLGESDNAGKCKLLNPDAIKLYYDKQSAVLTANSDELLIIENKALGYKLHYLLNDFSLDQSLAGNNPLSYSGTLFFEELKGSKGQQKKWSENRLDTYKGSIVHFFRSVFNNSLAKEGFAVYEFPDRETIKLYTKKQQRIASQYFLPITSTNKFFSRVNENCKIFDLGVLKKDSTELYVIYTLKHEPDKFIRSMNAIRLAPIIPPGQTSVIHPLGDTVLVSKIGGISPSGNMLRMGFWAWGRTADFLPSDYKVGD